MEKSGYIGRSPGDSSVTIARQTNTAVGVQTTFVFNSGYDVGYLDVYLNGSKLINAIDYTATDTQNVIFETPTEDGDSIEFVAYKAFNVTNTVTELEDDLTLGGDVNAENLTVETLVVTGVSTLGQVEGISGISTTFVSAVGIQSGGLTIGAGITQLNFIGVGNTFQVDGTTVDISIGGIGDDWSYIPTLP